MKLRSAAAVSALLALLIAVPAFAAPDVYVVNFRHAEDATSQKLDSQLASALEMARVNAEEVVIDTTTAAKWEKAAHDAFNRDIVPVFNKWVGLPGFAAVVDANSKTVIGCVNASVHPTEMAREIQQMVSVAKGDAYISKASSGTTATQCPDAYNKPLVD